MISVENPLLVLLVFAFCTLLAVELLLHTNNWTRRVGRFVLWTRKTPVWRDVWGGAYYEAKARKAIDAPEQVVSYRVILVLTGIVSLGISLCSLLGLLSLLVGAGR